jgi:hypothetical protein
MKRDEDINKTLETKQQQQQQLIFFISSYFQTTPNVSRSSHPFFKKKHASVFFTEKKSDGLFGRPVSL